LTYVAFKEHVADGDIINVVIRAHLYLEHVLIKSLEDAFAVPDAMDLRRLNFPSKLDLCIALGLLPSAWRPAAAKINEMRNQVAHKIDFQFGGETKRELWSTLPDFLQEAILGDAHLIPSDAHQLTYAQIFRGFIVWLDIVRQKSNVNRIDTKFAQLHLRQVLDETAKSSADA
jgi:hypothetical protein